MSLPKAVPSKPPSDQDGRSPAANVSLPPVEAPTGTFILQLFLIPLLIVAIVVMVWLLFSWMANMGQDNPKTLVEALARGDDSSWQRAFHLADLLRSPDPKYDAMRRDGAGQPIGHAAQTGFVGAGRRGRGECPSDAAHVDLPGARFVRSLRWFANLDRSCPDRTPSDRGRGSVVGDRGITTLADRNGPDVVSGQSASDEIAAGGFSRTGWHGSAASHHTRRPADDLSARNRKFVRWPPMPWG